MIYFDNSATTKPRQEVMDTYLKVATTYFANPNSIHPLGHQSRNLMEQARKQILDVMKARGKQAYFTSGGTEANNLALRGIAKSFANRGKHIITTAMEHPSILESAEALKAEGFTITVINPDETGKVSVEEVMAAVREDTILVSVVHVNSEVGTINHIEELADKLKSSSTTYLHVDHVQGVTKVPLCLDDIDLVTISSHKFHGVKGSGCLLVNESIRMEAQILGGGQEEAVRSGTEHVPGVVAMAKALRLAEETREETTARLREINVFLEEKLSLMDGVIINSPTDRAPHILQFSIPNLKPEVLIQALAERDIYVSTTTACASKHQKPSQALMAMNKEKLASSAIRVSLSSFSTMEEADCFIVVMQKLLKTLAKVGR
ncbi:cysteine desulfurase [Paenalkalicoccus suaedae]|uniref:Cysteine desulfurase n=1 Tax=Paenalkalicoccus suaedae TaxID=2592382 RepID=A0A859FKH4_9BACI|nr:cysteine desulfurase family protein [Paenalkalicoccus suaedae]QKS73292.1 cysteine desulfurase [Paenalkalicoccus suaedae]